MIIIGQLAGYAGMTIKAARHNHQRGLLEEPPRDSSGYRRYSAQPAIHVVKIKTLAEAGVRSGKWHRGRQSAMSAEREG
jgi:DNA-binding transcriptional MerR regulator